MTPLRIFISSPGDVAEERDKAKQVIADLQRFYDNQVGLIPVLWEDLAIPATASFQEGIDCVLAEHHRIDIAVFILWSRLGSPLGAAITKPDGSRYLSGTEREFDVMLAAFEQSGGKTPIILAYTRRDEEGFNHRLDARKHGDDDLEEILQQRKLVKRFIREHFQDEEGHNVRAYHSYREPVGFAQRLHVHLRGTIDDLLELDPTVATWTEAPYRSLEVFDIRHAPIFRGRDEETCDLLQRLRDQQHGGTAFVCIVGASGSGKSSLARAGVAATLLERSFDEGVKEWRAVVFLPGLASGNLLPALAQSIATQLPELLECVGGIEDFAKCLEGPNTKATMILLETAFKTAGAKLGGSLRVLLVLDQLEELWTDRSITPDQRESFLQAVEALASGTHLTVLATLRSDFYPQAQLSPAFLRMKGERGHFDLTAPSPAALQELIVQPAHRAGLRFERDERTSRTLDQRILEDATRDPSALPLLQYALAELYEHRDETRHLLTCAAYEAMGCVEGALGKRAAQIFDGLPGDAQAALDDLLPQLVSVDITGEQSAVRRRAPLADLTRTPGGRKLTDSLIQARFLTTDDDKRSGAPIASLAHEALLRRWDRITSWINANRDLLHMRARIEQYQAMWEESRRDISRLLPSGLPLEEGRKLIGATTQVLDEKSKQFVVASASHHDQQQRRAVRLRRLAFATLGGLTVMASLAGWTAYRKSLEAIAQREKAERSLWLIGDTHENASKLIADVLIDLRSKLEPRGETGAADDARRTVKESFDDALQVVNERLGESEAPGDSEDSLHMRSVVLNSRGYLARRAGDLDAAENYYTKSLAIREELLRQNNTQALYQHDLAISHDNLGDLHVAKARKLSEAGQKPNQEFASAIAEYRKGLDLAKRLASRSDATEQWRHDLAVSYFKLGDALLENDEREKALTELRTGFPVAEQVAASDPSYSKWQAHLALYCLELGRLHALMAEIDTATGLFDRGMSIFSELTKKGRMTRQYAVWQERIAANLRELQ